MTLSLIASAMPAATPLSEKAGKNSALHPYEVSGFRLSPRAYWQFALSWRTAEMGFPVVVKSGTTKEHEIDAPQCCHNFLNIHGGYAKNLSQKASGEAMICQTAKLEGTAVSALNHPSSSLLPPFHLYKSLPLVLFSSQTQQTRHRFAPT